MRIPVLDPLDAKCHECHECHANLLSFGSNIVGLHEAESWFRMVFKQSKLSSCQLIARALYKASPSLCPYMSFTLLYPALPHIPSPAGHSMIFTQWGSTKDSLSIQSSNLATTNNTSTSSKRYCKNTQVLSTS